MTALYGREKTEWRVQKILTSEDYALTEDFVLSEVLTDSNHVKAEISLCNIEENTPAKDVDDWRTSSTEKICKTFIPLMKRDGIPVSSVLSAVEMFNILELCVSSNSSEVQLKIGIQIADEIIQEISKNELSNGVKLMDCQIKNFMKLSEMFFDVGATKSRADLVNAGLKIQESLHKLKLIDKASKIPGERLLKLVFSRAKKKGKNDKKLVLHFEKCDAEELLQLLAQVTSWKAYDCGPIVRMIEILCGKLEESEALLQPNTLQIIEKFLQKNFWYKTDAPLWILVKKHFGSSTSNWFDILCEALLRQQDLHPTDRDAINDLVDPPSGPLLKLFHADFPNANACEKSIATSSSELKREPAVLS